MLPSGLGKNPRVPTSVLILQVKRVKYWYYITSVTLSNLFIFQFHEVRRKNHFLRDQTDPDAILLPLLNLLLFLSSSALSSPEV